MLSHNLPATCVSFHLFLYFGNCLLMPFGHFKSVLFFPYYRIAWVPSPSAILSPCQMQDCKCFLPLHRLLFLPIVSFVVRKLFGLVQPHSLASLSVTPDFEVLCKNWGRARPKTAAWNSISVSPLGGRGQGNSTIFCYLLRSISRELDWQQGQPSLQQSPILGICIMAAA